MARTGRIVAVTVAGLAVLAWFVTQAADLPDGALDGLTADPVRGATIFAAAGCASCHSAPEGDENILSGGRMFPSDFGTFVAPNISSDPTHGVGRWSDLELANAIVNGTSPTGQHYYPVFPYASYAKAELQDIKDLIAHLRTLPASDQPNADHQVGFPFNIRTGVGVWKALYVNKDWTLTEVATPEVAKGRYLAEALGHCAECHTPRTALGGLDTSKWMGGAPNPSGKGRIPNITPAGLDWSTQEIAEYLDSGFTPDFDTAGGEMAAVVRNTSQLTDADRLAIAAYLKALPGVAN